MSTLLLDAILFAEKHHRPQRRKVSNTPYIIHPMLVSYIVASYKRSKNLESILAACWLHDVIEDCDVTYEELLEKFGYLVASIVLELTSDKEEIAVIGKLEYLKKKLLSISSYALVIKLADRLHNMKDSPTVASVSETIKLLDALETFRNLNKTQTKIVTDIRIAIQNRSRGVAY